MEAGAGDMVGNQDRHGPCIPLSGRWTWTSTVSAAKENCRPSGAVRQKGARAGFPEA